ncbi:hypothetical protein PHET_03114 [Paragonimus heterotremus]|uniref:protein-serine/threonine phosphatase n=1 Tax=Paragonimus heterotremus TaxID=100268 RepID=A0A8J4SRH4_9TREM|nr:hypothetical protein PHET_03114 [Paragonimus heterotremus]
MVSKIVSVPCDLKCSSRLRWKVKRRQAVNPSTVVCILESQSSGVLQITAPGHGWVTTLLDDEACVSANCGLFRFEPCNHHIVMKDLCAECGANLRREGGISGERIEDASAKIPMVHAIPELHVSETVAAELALQDEQSLLAARKLVLLVDLDETVLHTTNDPQAFHYKDLCMSLSINAGFPSHSNRALFPRGLNMVCIIDDRGEVWDWSPHLIQVKPYRFFQGAHDINIFPWSTTPVSTTTSTSTVTVTCTVSDSNLLSSTTVLSESTTIEDVSNVATSVVEQTTSESTKLNKSTSAAVTPALEMCDVHDVKTESVNSSCQSSTFVEEITGLGVPSLPTSDDGLGKNRPVDVAEAECDSDPASTGNALKSLPAEPEKLFGAADGNYLLRLQEILLSLHRSYYREYDCWRAAQSVEQHHMRRQSGDQSDRTSRSPSLSSSSSSRPHSPIRPSSHSNCVPNIANIISQHRSTVLGSDFHVTLSGLAPSHLPDRCFAARMVRSLGAVLHSGLRLPPPQVTGTAGLSTSLPEDKTADSNPAPVPVSVDCKEITEPKSSDQTPAAPNVYTTHLVACRRGTEKYNAAMNFLRSNSETSPSILHIVSPHWLWACYYHWKYLPESDYPLVQDYHPSEFDPEMEPAPGTLRYARRHRRHRAEHSPTCSPLYHNSPKVVDEHHGLFRYHIPHHTTKQRHYRKHTHHSVRHHDVSLDHPRDTESHTNLGGITPKLDVSIVQSALESIRAELELDREHAREKRKQRHDHVSHEEKHARKRHRSDADDALNLRAESLDAVSDPLVKNRTSVDLKPGKTTSFSIDVDVQGTCHGENSKFMKLSDYTAHPQFASVTTQCSHEPADAMPLSTDNEDPEDSRTVPLIQPPVVMEIQDADELYADGDAEITDNADDDTQDQDDEATDEQTESETTIESRLQQFLPPPKSLILADNPLIHLPPQATSQMLAEIEEAVMEEDAEKASSVPIEAELYDPATLGLGDTDSSMSSHHDLPDSGAEQVEDYDQDVVRSPSSKSRSATTHALHRIGKRLGAADSDCKDLQWQVRRELLLRRRCRASPEEVRKIDKKLRRLDACLRREDRRRRSTDDLVFGTRRACGRRAAVDLSVVQDTASEDSEDIWDADYPKGWSPEERAKSRSSCGYRFGRSSLTAHHRSLSVSPAIHSDPEPNVNWWRSAVDDDFSEWNTCPEGYDYVDAERTRALLMGDERAQNLQVYSHQIHRTHQSLTNCLFGTDDDDDDTEESGASADEEDEEASGGLSTDDGDDLTDVRWGPLREFM